MAIDIMDDEERMGLRLVYTFALVFIGEVLALSNSIRDENSTVLFTLMFITVAVWSGFLTGLIRRKEWARMTGMIVCASQGIASIVELVWFHSYIKGGDFAWSTLLTEAIIPLFVFVNFLIVWQLSRKRMKEYFAKK